MPALSPELSLHELSAPHPDAVHVMKTKNDPFPFSKSRSSEVTCFLSFQSTMGIPERAWFLGDRSWALLPSGTIQVSLGPNSKACQCSCKLYFSLAHFIPSPIVMCLGLEQLTVGWRAPCSSRHLSLLIPCCPACQSTRPPPRRKQKLHKPEMTSEEEWEIQFLWWVRMAVNYFLILSLFQRNPREDSILPIAPRNHSASPNQEGLPP